MFKNLKKTDMIGTNFTSNLFKHNNFIVFYGDFYLDGQFFFPISIKHNAGSFELFGNLAPIKYRKYFEQDFYNYTLNQKNNMEIIENSLILGSSGNYYHDLIDFYSKIFSYDNKIDTNIDKFIIGQSYLKDPIITLIKKINIQKKLVIINNETKIFKNSYFVSNKNFIKINDFYRHLFLNPNAQQFKNIYISRNDSKNRSIKNEKDVVNYLEKFDFEIYELSKISFLEQIKIFSEAKMIVSMHGAGLTNLMFCNPETKVVEIAADFYENYKSNNLDIDSKQFECFKNNETDWFSDINCNKYNKFTRSVFNQLSQMNGLNHYYYFVKSINLKKNKKIIADFEFKTITHTNLTVDMKIFKSFFQQILIKKK